MCWRGMVKTNEAVTAVVCNTETRNFNRNFQKT